MTNRKYSVFCNCTLSQKLVGDGCSICNPQLNEELKSNRETANSECTNIMNKFIGTKEVKARPLNLGAYNALRGWEMPKDENPDTEGYLVEYLDSPNQNHPDFDNYISWSPKDVFERSYRINENLTFGQAIEAAKQGKRIARSGWNGKGMFVFMRPADELEVGFIIDKVKSLPQSVKDFFAAKEKSKAEEVAKKAMASANPATVRFGAYICMYAADGSIVNGWLASQTDMLAEDWCVVD
jgi:hypothetical protein